jgi:hypothetical protein
VWCPAHNLDGSCVVDIYCVRCGEPWELDTFHDIADERGVTFAVAVEEFQRAGCVATGWVSGCDRATGGAAAARAGAMSVLCELLGDDVDGIASEMADWDAADVFYNAGRVSQ